METVSSGMNKKERRMQKRAESAATRTTLSRQAKVQQAGLSLLIVLLLGGGGYWWLHHSGSGGTVYDPTKDCTTDPRTKLHAHPHLVIKIDGKEQEVSTNIGISPTCMRSMHTHDTTGTIHVESPVARDYTLGEFFQIWGKSFDRNHILDYTVDAEHQLTMTVDDKPSDAFENLAVGCKDPSLTANSARNPCEGQHIVISYDKK